MDVEVCEPAFIGNGLDPFTLMPGGCFWSEVEVDGVSALALQLEDRAKGRFALIGGNLAARLRAVDRHRPKQFARRG